MTARQSVPRLWLLSDARNDARLETALRKLPRGSGFVFRHYHLPDAARRARFDALAALARSHGHRIVLAGPGDWGQDGVYGPPFRIRERNGLRLATAHDAAELDEAYFAGVDAAFLSPVFATNSHPGSPVLGPDRFLSLAQAAPLPVIALGGMTQARADALGWPRWGAIDGLA